MKKFLLSIFVVGALFTSCGSDNDPIPEDLTMYDLSSLKGNYGTECTIKVLNFARPSQVMETSVVLAPTNDSKILYLSTTEFGLIVEGDRLTNFNYTSLVKDKVTFNMGSFNKNELVGGDIPEYIHTWFDNDLTIEKVDIKFAATIANFTPATKALTFEYTATATIRGKVSGIDVEPKIVNLKYNYNLIHE